MGPRSFFRFEPGQQRRYRHEQYSAAIIRTQLRDVIENHALNQNCDLKADAVAALLEGRTAGHFIFGGN